MSKSQKKENNKQIEFLRLLLQKLISEGKKKTKK